MDGNKSIKVFLIFVLYKCICAQLPNSTTILPLVNLTGNINGTYMRGELEKEFFLQRLFERYGNNGVLKLEGLNSMFKNIGISSNDITNKNSKDTTGVQNNHIHSHDLKVVKSINRKKNNDPLIYFKRKKRDIPNKQEDLDVKHIQHPECLKTSELLQVYHFNTNRTITQEDFTNLCPGLITVLDRKTCNILTDGVDFDLHYEDRKRHVSDIPSSVWGYSSLSVFIISLVGLLGVAVIPVMQKVFYNHLLQFLVALAVGALSGDAMLHLIPHALAGEHEPHDETDAESIAEKYKERENVIKGLVGLLGIYFFFMIERLMTIITELKRKRQEKEHEKIKRKYADELGDAELKEVEAQLPVIHDHHECHDDCGHMEFGIHPGNKALEQLVEETQRDQLEENVLEEKLQSMHSLDKLGLPDSKSGSEMQNNTGHGHSHGHSHGPLPKSVAAIAWMVILGDGIHNFSDGLAIGAAFSNSLTGGISTSIAVFCHELPHEIGDFAVLLKAGMQPKQAIVYNVVSSVLAFMGMLIGVVIGNLSEASTWIFAIVGGMFLYVALVDMLPEMMSVKTKDGENPFCHLMFQVCGMMVGIGIMLLIGLFEEDLKTMLE